MEKTEEFNEIESAINWDANIEKISRELCCGKEISPTYSNDFRIGRFQLYGVKGEYIINYITKEDLLNGNFKYKRTSENGIKYENNREKAVIGITVGSEEEFPAFMYWDDLYPYVLSFLGAYEILADKEKLTNKEKNLKDGIYNFITSEKFIKKEEILSLYEKVKETIKYDDFCLKVEQGKEIVKNYRKEQLKEQEEKNKEAVEKYNNDKKFEKQLKKERILRMIFPVLIPVQFIKDKLTWKKEQIAREAELNEIRRKIKENEIIRKEEIKQEVKEFSNF